MSCISPITAYRSRSLSSNGKRPLVFNRADGFCDLPVVIPCGVCIGCRIASSRTWALRCVHESKQHVFNSFVTLTYSEENLPSDTSVEKRTLQLFFKRLRKAGFDFRYFACGEYGDSTNRPHYHVIFFGIDFHADRTLYKRTSHGSLYTSPTLSRIWGLGHAIIANFSFSTASYVTKYVLKKRLGKDAGQSSNYSRFDLSTGELFQVDREFVLMSRRPGIGSLWFERFSSDAFPSDFLIHDSKKFSVPRYYFDKLQSKDSLLAKAIKSKRKVHLSNNSSSFTPQRLEAKELILSSRENLYKRGL